MGLGVFHHHPFTGLPCDCGYGRPKFVRRTGRVSGVNWNRAVKTQIGGKKFQVIEGAQAFIGWMNELMQDDPEGWRDEIAPFLVKEFRSGNITFDENRRAFMRTDHGEQGIGMGIADRWGRWAAARQHPTRRGVNITGPDLTTMNIGWKVDPFYQDMQQREEHQRKVEAMQESLAPAVYNFNDGWTVRDLVRAPNPAEEMELEGQIMDHCIGNDGEHPHTGYSYIDAASDGAISHVYSVRDPEGMPHVTLHLNADGSLAEIHGYNDQVDALRKYAPRAAHFLRERHPETMARGSEQITAEDMHNGNYPWTAVGNRFDNPHDHSEDDDEDRDEWGDDEEPEEEENPYLDEYEVSAPNDMSDVYELHEALTSEGDEHDYIQNNVSPDYYQAHEEGHSPDLSFLGPNWGNVVHDMNTNFAYGDDEERQEVRDFIEWMRKEDPSWFLHLRTAIQHNTANEQLRAEFDHLDREAEIQRNVNEMFPGAEDPKRLFHTILEDGRGRSVGDPWNEDQYTYPVTNPDIGLGEDQYLAPTDKRFFINQERERKMQDMRDEGHSWDDISRAFGAGGYADETNPAQQSLNARRQEEYQAMRAKRRGLRHFVQNREETDAPRDPEGSFIPYTMDDVQNKARGLHWQEMVNSGLTPDTASQRIIEYERRVRSNPDHCQVCGDYGAFHARDCPNAPENLQGRLGPPGPAGGGTLSRVAMAFPGDLFHVSPASNRKAIMSEGLRAHERGAVPMFNPTGHGRGIPGNYAFEHEKDALFYAHMHARSNKPMDIWRIRNTGALPVEQDPESYMLGQGEEIPREEAPQAHQFDTGAEMGLDADEDPPHSPTYYWMRPEPEGWSEEDDGSWYDHDDSMEQVGGRQMAWRIPAHVPPEQLQHVRHVNPGDATWDEEHWMGDALQGWLPDHLAPEPYHRVQWGSPQEYQQAIQQWHERDSRASVDRMSGTRSLYHGTLRDHLPSIQTHGLTPEVGDFVNDAYGDLDGYFDGDDAEAAREQFRAEHLRPLVFMSDKQHLHKAVTAMRHHIARKLGLGFHDVTENHVRNHGLIVKRPGEMGWSDDPTSDKFVQLDQSPSEDHDYPWYDKPAWEKQQEERFRYEERPHYSVEPGDYYSESTIDPGELQFLHGPALLRFLRGQGQLPFTKPWAKADPAEAEPWS